MIPKTWMPGVWAFLAALPIAILTAIFDWSAAAYYSSYIVFAIVYVAISLRTDPTMKRSSDHRVQPPAHRGA